MKSKTFLKRYRIDKPDHFRLASFDPDDTAGLDLDKQAAKSILVDDIERLSDLQARLYAMDRRAVLMIFQGIDAAGKDGAIKHVMSGLNPQGCEVHSFRPPSEEELAHDFLWRAALRLPRHGRIGIFNRSYYEEVLVARVHPGLLGKEKIPARLVSKNIWQERFQDIRAFERHLARSGILLLKFFLHISKEEQRRRFLARLEEPAKRWKFSMADISERQLWDKYMAAYEDMIRATSHPGRPWYVVPANNKPFARLVVAAAMIEGLEGLDLQFPKVEGKALEELLKIRQMLLSEGSAKGGSKNKQRL
jgi:PPK2 family polyphosphate:nucleotide phosphotransferase